MTPDNASYMHVAYALVLLGIVGYVASLAVRARALAKRADALRPGASRRA